MKKIVATLLAIATCFLLCACGNTGGKEDELNETNYQKALEHIASGEYESAYAIFEELGDYKDAKSQLDKFHFAPTKMMITYGYDSEVIEGSVTADYNDKNLPIKSVATFDNEDLCIDFTYDESGNIIQEKHLYPDGENEIYTYAYDANGNVIEETHIDEDGDKYIDSYTYDVNGNVIQHIYTDADGDKSIYDYTFDTNGNLIKTVYTSYNGNKSITDYTYDATGNLIKEVYTDTDGDKDTTDYSYDENGNIIKYECTYYYGYKISFAIDYKFVYIPYDISEEELEEIYITLFMSFT